MTTPTSGCRCEPPAALLLRECVLVIASLLSLGVASPIALAHMAVHLTRSRALLPALAYLVMHAVALVMALGMLDPLPVAIYAVVACLGIAVVTLTLPSYRRARMAACGWRTCSARRSRTAEIRELAEV